MPKYYNIVLLGPCKIEEYKNVSRDMTERMGHYPLAKDVIKHLLSPECKIQDKAKALTEIVVTAIQEGSALKAGTSLYDTQSASHANQLSEARENFGQTDPMTPRVILSVEDGAITHIFVDYNARDAITRNRVKRQLSAEHTDIPLPTAHMIHRLNKIMDLVHPGNDSRWGYDDEPPKLIQDLRTALSQYQPLSINTLLEPIEHNTLKRFHQGVRNVAAGTSSQAFSSNYMFSTAKPESVHITQLRNDIRSPESDLSKDYFQRVDARDIIEFPEESTRPESPSG